MGEGIFIDWCGAVLAQLPLLCGECPWVDRQQVLDVIVIKRIANLSFVGFFGKGRDCTGSKKKQGLRCNGNIGCHSSLLQKRGREF